VICVHETQRIRPGRTNERLDAVERDDPPPASRRDVRFSGCGADPELRRWFEALAARVESTDAMVCDPSRLARPSTLRGAGRASRRQSSSRIPK
jgi:hypothetical protein